MTPPRPLPPVRFKPGHEAEGKRLNYEIARLAVQVPQDWNALNQAVNRRNAILDL